MMLFFKIWVPLSPQPVGILTVQTVLATWESSCHARLVICPAEDPVIKLLINDLHLVRCMGHTVTLLCGYLPL